MALKRLVQGLVVAAAVAAIVAAPAVSVSGGTVIQVQAAPWTVFVQQVAGSARFLCTGSVVDPSHILTAAHCLFDEAGNQAQPVQLSIKAGVSNFTTPLSTDLEQDRAVSSYRIHPGYVWNSKPTPDDVAVLALAVPLDVSGAASPDRCASVRRDGLPGRRRRRAGRIRAPESDDLLERAARLDDGDRRSTGLLRLERWADRQQRHRCLRLVTHERRLQRRQRQRPRDDHRSPGPDRRRQRRLATCGSGTHGLFTYTGAPEILQFIQGVNTPPTAPRANDNTFLEIKWDPPLVVGNTLSCTTSGWVGQAQFTYMFVNSGTGDVLQSGPAPKYLVPATAVGDKVTCEVAASNAGGTTLEETDPTSAIKPAPQVRIQKPAPISAVPGSHVSLHVTLLAPLGLWGKYDVCVTLPAKVGGHLCRSMKNTDGSSGAFPFNFTFKIRPTAPIGTAKIAIAATAGVSSAGGTALLRISR